MYQAYTQSSDVLLHAPAIIISKIADRKKNDKKTLQKLKEFCERISESREESAPITTEEVRTLASELATQNKPTTFLWFINWCLRYPTLHFTINNAITIFISKIARSKKDDEETLQELKKFCERIDKLALRSTPITPHEVEYLVTELATQRKPKTFMWFTDWCGKHPTLNFIINIIFAQIHGVSSDQKQFVEALNRVNTSDPGVIAHLETIYNVYSVSFNPCHEILFDKGIYPTQELIALFLEQNAIEKILWLLRKASDSTTQAKKSLIERFFSYNFTTKLAVFLYDVLKRDLGSYNELVKHLRNSPKVEPYALEIDKIVQLVQQYCIRDDEPKLAATVDILDQNTFNNLIRFAQGQNQYQAQELNALRLVLKKQNSALTYNYPTHSELLQNKKITELCWQCKIRPSYYTIDQWLYENKIAELLDQCVHHGISLTNTIIDPVTQNSEANNPIFSIKESGTRYDYYFSRSSNLADIILVKTTLASMYIQEYRPKCTSPAHIIAALNNGANPNNQLKMTKSRIDEGTTETSEISLVDIIFRHLTQVLSTEITHCELDPYYYIILVAFMFQPDNSSLLKSIDNLSEQHKKQLGILIFKILTNNSQLENLSLAQKTNLLFLAEKFDFNAEDVELLLLFHAPNTERDSDCFDLFKRFYIWGIDGLLQLNLSRISPSKQKILITHRFAEHTNLPKNHAYLMNQVRELKASNSEEERQYARQIASDLLSNSLTTEQASELRAVLVEIPTRGLASYPGRLLNIGRGRESPAVTTTSSSSSIFPAASRG